MKRIVLAGVVALALTLACQQKASAWGWQLTTTIGADWKCWGNCPQACGYAYPPAWAAPGYNYWGGYGVPPAPYAPPAYYYAPAAALAPAAPAQPTTQAQVPTAAAQPSVEPIGYYYGGYGNGNYGSYQAPSYWYGR